MRRPPPSDGASADGPLAIVCGGGSLPLAVADAVRRRGRDVLLFPVRGFAGPEVERFPCHWVALGQLGRIFRRARAAGCRDVVFIGALVRPSLAQLRFDWMTIRALPRLVRAFRGGDDHLLAGVARVFEDEGFRLVGAHEVAPDLLLPEGVLGRRHPAERDRGDIAHALALLAATGPFDVGQAAVVADRHVLAIEAAEGTDRMLERITALRQEGRIRAGAGIGVLVKAPKPGQDRRFDLPSIGPPTVTGVARAGLAGLAAVAGATVVAEPEEVARRAEAEGVFVVGLPARGAGA
ncbi:MAG TPA: UDP-2,3-diacylglucosamine diphosphatase LpxI [Xanthobacteraceae bacterium]|nr:UDP-2,3-diacylglucosamine diphosphatase LpxI [Xanthobacteraceae bacterium]